MTSEALKVGPLGTRTGLFDYIRGSADTAIIRERGDLRDVDPKKERRKKEEWSRTGGSETRKEQLVIRVHGSAHRFRAVGLFHETF